MDGETFLALRVAREAAVRIFMYVLKHDSGFAPNPFHGWCTLACCRPAIRRRAQPGNWIVGITPRNLGNDVAYAMRIKETLSFEEYWADPRFRAKRPRRESRSRITRCGDNCYEPVGHGKFLQHWSAHWDDESDQESAWHKAKDLRGKRVLVAQRFSYFGANPQPFPASISLRLPERFNRVNFSEKEIAALRVFLEGLPRGIRGRPGHWPDGDTSWRRGPSRCG